MVTVLPVEFLDSREVRLYVVLAPRLQQLAYEYLREIIIMYNKIFFMELFLQECKQFIKPNSNSNKFSGVVVFKKQLFCQWLDLINFISKLKGSLIFITFRV